MLDKLYDYIEYSETKHNMHNFYNIVIYVQNVLKKYPYYTITVNVYHDNSKLVNLFKVYRQNLMKYPLWDYYVFRCISGFKFYIKII